MKGFVKLLIVVFSLNSYSFKKDLSLKEVAKRDLLLVEQEVESLESNSESFSWKFFLESWLIKNEKDLGWDKDHISYNLRKDFSIMLKKMGYQKKYKILMFEGNKYDHFSFDLLKDLIFISLNKDLLLQSDYSHGEALTLCLELYQAAEMNFFKQQSGVKVLLKEMRESQHAETLMDKLMGKYSSYLRKDRLGPLEMNRLNAKTFISLKSNMEKLNDYIGMNKKRKSLIKKLPENYFEDRAQLIIELKKRL